MKYLAELLKTTVIGFGLVLLLLFILYGTNVAFGTLTFSLGVVLPRWFYGLTVVTIFGFVVRILMKR